MENAYDKFYSEQEDILDWAKEANGVIRDIETHVQEARLSNRFKHSDSEAYINIRTLEGTEVLVKLSRDGLQIVGDGFDCNDREDKPNNVRYETSYSLLTHLSPAYVESFGKSLSDALSKQIEERLVDNDQMADASNMK